jgi:hypothetical protein
MHHAWQRLAGRALTFLLLALMAFGALAQNSQKARGPVFPTRDLPAIPLPGRTAPTPFLSQPNSGSAPTGAAMPAAQQPRGTLPQPPRSALEAAIARPFVMDVATARLLADTKAFTARAEMDLALGPALSRATNTVPLVVAFLDGRLRMDMDVNEVRSLGFPAPAFSSLIEMGLNQVVSVVRPEKRVLHILYPDVRGYLDFPLTPEESAGTMKVERADTGRGTANGEPCAMQRIVLTREGTNRHDAIVWLSDAQRGFPVQIQWNEPNAQVTFRFLQVNIVKPDLALFEPPSEYAKYPDYTVLIQTAAARKNALTRTRREP